MKRRATVVAALTLAITAVTAPVLADDRIVTNGRGDTNGCVVVVPAKLAICIPRL